MDGGWYDGGFTTGGRWGCAVAALIGSPLFLLLMIVDALGDCAPNVSCRKGFLTNVALPSLIFMLAVWLVVRDIVNRFKRNGS